MANKPKSLSEIQRDIQYKTLDVLMNRIEPIIKQWIQDATYDYVYSTYDPIDYVRREDVGGLADMKFMVDSMVHYDMVTGQIQRKIEHLAVAKEDGPWGRGEFSKAIQRWHSYAGDPDTGMPARPYMFAVKARVDQEREYLYDEFIKGMRAKGVPIQKTRGAL